MKILKYHFSVLFILFYLTSFSQNQNNFWAFGYHNGLDFTSGSPVFWKSNIESWQKTTSISDENGQLLFYTDGASIYDANGNPMMNGEIDQPIIIRRAETFKLLILKSPAEENKYYLFINKNRDLSYSLIDMSLNSGKGAVLEKNILLAKSIMDIVLSKGIDCFNYWLIAPSIEDSSFLAYNINELGIQIPVKSTGFESYYKNVDNDLYHSSPTIVIAPDFTKLITVRYKDERYDQPGDSTFYLFRRSNFLGFDISNFNTTTGEITNPVFISQSHPDYIFNWISSLCFSPDGRRLYVSRTYSETIGSPLNTELSQYDCSLLSDSIAFKSSKNIIDTSSPNNYMRLAPDGKIYLSFSMEDFYVGRRYGSFSATSFMSCIPHPNEVGNNSDFEQRALDYPSYTEFPTGSIENRQPTQSGFYGYFLPELTLDQQFRVKNSSIITHFLCPFNPMTINVNGDFDRYEWFDGSSEVQYDFTEPGIYWVYKYKGCQLTIDSFELNLAKVKIREKDTVLCKLGVPEIKLHAEANIPGSFYWNTGETDSVITVRKSGKYVVSHNNECGVLRDTVEVIFLEDCDCQPFVPNAFTPNGDGLNDVFKIQEICPTQEFVFSIFNRYGQRVFVSYHIENSWDGSFQGKPLPSDTYFYRLSYQATGSQKFQLKGNLVLLR